MSNLCIILGFWNYTGECILYQSFYCVWYAARVQISSCVLFSLREKTCSSAFRKASVWKHCLHHLFALPWIWQLLNLFSALLCVCFQKSISSFSLQCINFLKPLRSLTCLLHNGGHKVSPSNSCIEPKNHVPIVNSLFFPLNTGILKLFGFPK